MAAVLGSPLNGRTERCNHLIREGATLLRNIDYMLECLARPPVASLPTTEEWQDAQRNLARSDVHRVVERIDELVQWHRRQEWREAVHKPEHEEAGRTREEAGTVPPRTRSFCSDFKK